ncbi:hypothetical protein D3C72_1683480 [compost metagenome]
MFGAGAGEDVAILGRLPQRGVAQAVQVGAGQYGAGVLQADLRADGGGGLGVVAGNHLDADAGLSAGAHRLDGLGPGRVDHSHHAQQRQGSVDIAVFQHGMRGLHGPHRKAKQALAAGGDAVGFRAPIRGVQRFHAAIGRALVGAHGQDSLRRALHIDGGLPLVVVA